MSDTNGKKNGKQRQNSGGIANLKPFKPGQCGNPNGRPKGKSLTPAIYRELAKDMPGKDGLTKADAVILSLVNNAIKGDHSFMRMLLDRVAPAALNLNVASMPPEDILARLDEIDARKFIPSLVAKRNGKAKS